MKATKRMGERNIKRALTKKNERQKTMGWMVYGMMFGWLSVIYGQGGTKLITGDFLNDSFECQIIYIQEFKPHQCKETSRNKYVL